MIQTRSAEPGAQGGAATERCVVFVPVDGSTACARAVDLAVRLALRSSSEIVLVDWFAGVADSEEPAGAADSASEDSTAQRLHNDLLPLELRITSAGIEVSGRMLHGDEPAMQLRATIGEAGTNRALVLINPLDLAGPLRQLTGDLLLTPPCTVYLTGSARHGASSSRRVLAGAMSGLWHQLLP